MNLLEANRWYQDLSAAEQEAFRSLFTPVDKLPQYLLAPDQGGGLDANLQAAALRWDALVAAGKPFYLARIGDCELGVLGLGYFPHTKHKSEPAREYWRCGYGRDFLPYRPELIAAYRDAHLLGVQENWLPWRQNTITVLHALGFPIPHPNAVDVHLPYQALIDGRLFKFLEGKKVLLVGGLAGQLAGLWQKTEFISAHLRFGPLNWVKSIQAVGLSDRKEGGGAWREMDEVTARIKRMEFDVALVSAAVPAKILARRIWAMGKTALDVGFVFDALIGNLPTERALRPCFRDVKNWPAKNW